MTPDEQTADQIDRAQRIVAVILDSTERATKIAASMPTATDADRLAYYLAMLDLSLQGEARIRAIQGEAAAPPPRRARSRPTRR